MRLLHPFLILLLCLALPLDTSAAPSAKPLIEQVRGRTVRVRVPAGLHSIVLERLTSARQGRWEVVASRATGQVAGTIEFQLSQAVSRRFLRVKAVTAPAAPGALAGARLFLADPALTGRGAFASALGDRPLSPGSRSANADATTSSAAAREIAESDIWRIAGDRLYFFNELRGLQVFDIANPDDPALLGQLRLPGAGEQMYLLGTSHAALLTRGQNSLRIGVVAFRGFPDSGGSDTGAVVIVDVAQGRPVEVARVEYRGWLRESRRVGSVLYLVSEVWGGGGATLEVMPIDLSDPAQPVKRPTLSLAGWGGVIHATDRFLFVVSGDWVRSSIDIIDITSPTGAVAKRGRVEVAGRIEDKFKMHLDGDTFTAVSAVSRRWDVTDPNDPANQSRTTIETFSLANPDAPAALGTLTVGHGETVRATRFDDQRLYVVTFFQIDPLWVIDLTNPATPTLLGELEIPGFSTYIEPLGDRLVAVGRLNNQTAVALFDVSDPTRPAVLSQIPLGTDSSWSEANWKEKAFNVMPEENLIVVPYSGYEPGSGYASRVQLLDLTRDAINKRGVIDHGLAARRTAVKGERLLAISGTDLVTVDIADRDQPRVTSEVEIAWRVDRVFLAGQYLLQVGGTADWRADRPQTVSVSTASDPDAVLTTVELGAASVLGATVRDGRLYIAQRNPEWYSDLVYVSNASGTNAAPGANPFILSVFDLTSLPALPRLARTESPDVRLGYLHELDAVWPGPGVLVWVRSNGNRYFHGGPIGIPVLQLNGAVPSIASPLVVASGQTLISGNPTGSVSVVSAGTVSGGLTLANPAGAAVAVANDSASSGRVATGIGSGTLTLNGTASATVSTGASLGKVGAGSLQVAGDIALPWWGNADAGLEALVFDVSTASAPVLAAKLNIRAGSTGDWSEPFAAGGKLYVSSMAYEDFVTIGETPATPVKAPSRRYRHFLKVVDLANPAQPAIGADVNIPGRLIGLSNAGSRLYTVGCRYAADATPEHARALHVSDFDGTAATFVDQVALPDYGASYALEGDTAFVGVPGADRQPNRFEAWQLDSATAKFARRSETIVDDASTLAVLNGLLVASSYHGDRQLFDVTDAVNVRPLGRFPANANDWSGGGLRHADGSPTRGLWEPLRDYGVQFVEFPR
jgi:hypothetical protein